MNDPERSLAPPRHEIKVPEVPLAPSRPSYPQPPVQPLVSNGADSSELLEYWRSILRHKVTLVLGAFLGALGAFYYSTQQTPIYQASATLEIRGFNEKLMNMSEVNPALSSGSYSEAYINTLVELLRSKSVVRRVVTKLNIHEGFKSSEPNSRPGWRELVGLPTPAPLPPLEGATRASLGALNVRPSPDSHIISIAYDSADPDLASQFVNTLAEEFVEQTLEVRWNSSQRTADWLTDQLKELKVALKASEETLQSYAKDTGLMFTSQETITPQSVAEQKLKQLQEALTGAQAERMQKQSQYEMVTSIPADSIPAVLDSGPITQYQVRLAELRRELAQLSSGLTPAHYLVQRVKAQIAEVESTLENERHSIISRIKNDYESSRRREDLLSADYAKQSELVSEQARKAIQYSILKGEVETNRQLYQAMLQQVKEASFAAALQATNIRVVDAASTPTYPYKPNLSQNLALGTFAGLTLSMLFVLARGAFDRSIKSPGETPLYLNVPEFGCIPAESRTAFRLLGVKPRQRRNTSHKSITAGARPSDEKHDSANQHVKRCVELVTWQKKPSVVAESFRATLASILFSARNGDAPQVIVFTSCAPSEGKTTAVTNLGITLAEISRRVLLVDCDLRKPRLASIFGFPHSQGLIDLLRDRRPVEECTPHAMIHTTEIPGLCVLPAGVPEANVSSLFYSVRMPHLIRNFRRNFDTVLLDTPPMMQMSDARILGRMADGVILVLRAGRTTRDTALAARQRLGEDHIPVLGTILNHWDPKTDGYGYYGGYYGRYSYQ